MLRYTPLLALMAGPAAAHQTPLPHVHGAEAGLWLGLGLIAAAAAYLARTKIKQRAEAGRRGRRP